MQFNDQNRNRGGKKYNKKIGQFCKQNVLLFQVKLYAMNTEKYNPIKAQQQKKKKKKD